MRTTKTIMFAVGALLLASLGGARAVGQGQKSAEELYQTALVMKEGRGDLEGAVKLFARILSEYPKDRAVAGKAQLQIGLCYEKLGESRAQEAYHKVIADFQDQPEVVKLARERLEALAKPSAPAAPPSGGMVLREVDLPSGKISPDGKWIASGEYDVNISLYEIGTKKKTLLTHYKSGAKLMNMIWGIGWDHSSQSIAYILWETESLSSLHLVDLTGAHDKVVYELSGNGLLMDFAGWSRDGKTVYVIVTDNSGFARKTILKRLALETGEFQDLRVYEGRAIGDAVLSPNGRSLACAWFHGQGMETQYKIIGIDLISGTETILNEHPVRSIPLVWTDDGRSLIFSSKRSGVDAVWVLPMRNGQSAGEPWLVKEFSATPRAMGVVNGNLYVDESGLGGDDVYVAQVELATGRTLREPTPVEKDCPGVTSRPLWSPDGRSISYLFRSSLRPGNALEGFDTLRIRDLATNAVTDFRSPVRMALVQRWANDGEWIYLWGMNSGPTASRISGLYRVNVQTGDSSLVFERRSGEGHVIGITGDGKTVYKSYVTRGNSGAAGVSWVTRMNLETHAETELYRGAMGEFILAFLSSDDKWIGLPVRAANGTTKFFVIPADGGEGQTYFETKSDENEDANYLFFSGPPGKGFFYIKIRFVNNDRVPPAEIWHVASAGKLEPKMLDLKIDNAYVPPGLAFNPDGKSVAFQMSRKPISMRWVLENFLR